MTKVSVVNKIRRQKINVNRLAVLAEPQRDNRSATEQATVLFEKRPIQTAGT
jgi:hypothetical protein